MKILVTGSAGFIGAALSLKLLERGNKVIGIDNHNKYYNPLLKEDRLKILKKKKNYKHIRADISSQKRIKNIFRNHKFNCVVNLAAQAGVRYSIENPNCYIDSNLVGFSNILEACRNNDVDHLVYASSSSVYGMNTTMPFSVNDNCNHPVSLYAATKKANELMAHSYSHLYKIPTTGLRFFTVYGPWGRPDMALHKFANSIKNNETIYLYNHGKHTRDFTYIDDVVESIIRVIDKPAKANLKWNSKKPDLASSRAPWCIYNIGNDRPMKLLEYVNHLERFMGIKAKKKFLPLQPGDVPNTWASMKNFQKKFNFKSYTSIELGIERFVNWYNTYYKNK